MVRHTQGTRPSEKKGMELVAGKHKVQPFDNPGINSSYFDTESDSICLFK